VPNHEERLRIAIRIVQASLCVECIAARTNIEALRVVELLEAIGQVTLLDRRTGVCERCGAVKEIYTIA